MTLQECKDQMAQQYSHESFDEYLRYAAKMYNTDHPEYVPDIIKIVDKATKLYAKEKVKEALFLAAESAEVIYHDGTNKIDTHHKQVTVGNNHIRPNRGKILSLETELLNKIEKEV